MPKRRKQTLYGNVRKCLGSVFHALASHRRSHILAGHMVQEHVPMLIRIPPTYAVAEVVGYLKGTSASAVARQCGGRPRTFHGESFWARGYAVSTVGFEAEQMRRDIRGQEQLENQGEAEDDECSDSVRTVTLAALGAAHNRQVPRSAGAS